MRPLSDATPDNEMRVRVRLTNIMFHVAKRPLGTFDGEATYLEGGPAGLKPRWRLEGFPDCEDGCATEVHGALPNDMWAPVGAR